jgi:hypothetical protein
MWTFCILGILAIILMVISFRWYNILLSLFGAIAWMGLWAYNLNNHPTGIVIGSFVHQILTYMFIGLAIVTMLLYFRSRGQAAGTFNSGSDKEGLPIISNQIQSRGVMGLDDMEYKAYIHARANRRKRG